jgi:copper oxidase (laccase) domain-containing protein
LLQRIAEKTVGEMRRAFHSQPEELRAAIGPSIRACCYEVGLEVVDNFQSRFTRCEGYFSELGADGATRAHQLQSPPSFLSARPPGREPAGAPAARLDLVAVTRHQLHNARLRSVNIHVADFCTACRTDLFFSHRQEGKTGRMLAVIGMV